MCFRYWQNPDREILWKTTVKESYIENFIKKLWREQDTRLEPNISALARSSEPPLLWNLFLKTNETLFCPLFLVHAHQKHLIFFYECSWVQSKFDVRLHRGKKDKLLLLELKRNTKALFSCVKIAINTHWMLHVKNMPLTPQTEQLLSSVFFSSSSSRSSPTAKMSRDKKECASRE